MTRRNARISKEQAPPRSAADLGLRHLVVAGAARIERAEAGRDVAAWHHVDREWSRRSSWRTRQHVQQGADDE